MPEFNEQNLTDEEPNAKLPLEVAFDEGYIDPRAMYVIQRTASTILVADELYQRQTLAEKSVSDLIERCAQRHWPKPKAAIGSPEAKELQERLRLRGIPAQFMPHKVVDGIGVLRRLICDGNGYRTLKVNRRCKNLIWELTEGWQYPEGTHGDAEKPLDGNDHGCEAIRNLAYMRTRPQGWVRGPAK